MNDLMGAGSVDWISAVERGFRAKKMVIGNPGGAPGMIPTDSLMGPKEALRCG